MISRKLKYIFLISLVLVYTHGLEEIFTGFQHNDSFMVFGAQMFSVTTETFYWVSHMLWWILVPILYILFKNRPLIFLLMSLYGFVFIIETHHVIKAFVMKSYYPGMITASFYPIIGLFYWKQLIYDWRRNK